MLMRHIWISCLSLYLVLVPWVVATPVARAQDAVSVVTITSTALETVTQTSTTVFETTSITSTCDVASASPTVTTCVNTIWSSGSSYFQQSCSYGWLASSTLIEALGGVPYMSCVKSCIASTSCGGVAFFSNINLCELFTGSSLQATRGAASYDQMMLIHTTNPCVSTLSDVTTTLTTVDTSTFAYTTTYISTITLSIQASTVTPSSSFFVTKSGAVSSRVPSTSATPSSSSVTTSGAVSSSFHFTSPTPSTRIASSSITSLTDAVSNSRTKALIMTASSRQAASSSIRTIHPASPSTHPESTKPRISHASTSAIPSSIHPLIPGASSPSPNSLAIKVSSTVPLFSTPAISSPKSISSDDMATSIHTQPYSSESLFIPSISKPSKSAFLRHTPSAAAPSSSLDSSTFLSNQVSTPTDVVGTASTESMSTPPSVLPVTDSTPTIHTTGLGKTMPVLESSSGELRYTTSTVLSTRIATITACPSGGTDCSAREKTSYTTTETILVTTTVCPITRSDATKTAPTETSDIGLGGDRDDYTTSTIFSTRTATITACPSILPDCVNQQKTSYTMTETLVISTTVYPVTGAEATRSVETSITEPHFVPVPGSTSTFLVSSPGSEFGKSFISGSGHNASEAYQTSGLDFTKSTMSGVNSQTAVREDAPVGTSQKPIPTLVVTIASPAPSDSTTIQDEYASSSSHPATSSSSLYQSKATSLVKASSAPLFTSDSLSKCSVTFNSIAAFSLLAILALVL